MIELDEQKNIQKNLIKQVSDTRIIVVFGMREIILIGTAHVSKESIDEVQSVIKNEKPAMVCIELDEKRYASMMQNDNWEKLDIIKVFREGKGFMLIANLILSGFQRRLGSSLGVKPGQEMKTAVLAAEAAGIPFSFCDREIQITLSRAWSACGFWSRCKLLAALLSSAFTSEKLSEKEIENLKNKSELDGMMTELASYLPEVKATLIDERDKFLASKIWDASQKTTMPCLPKNDGVAHNVKTIAVVGAGHLKGLAAHLEKIALGLADSNTGALNVIPPKSSAGKIAGWVIPILIVALIISGYFYSGADVSFNMLLQWVLWNGSLAALGSLIALAHPLAILVSFIAAPIGTLSPFLAVGFFSGAVQAICRKPRVTDAENLSDDTTSLKGIYKNRITHALLVFFLSSIGGAIGNFISIPNLLGIMFK